MPAAIPRGMGARRGRCMRAVFATMSEYERGLIASHEDEIEESYDRDERAADCALAKELARKVARELLSESPQASGGSGHE